LPWHFGVIESGDVNAFAAPGGYVFITRGLYLLLQDEAELAGVLGHEIGHVILKHHLKILQQSNLLDAGSKLVTHQVGGDDKIQKIIGSGAEIVSRSLDKNAEFEADRVGVVLSARAGYDVFGLPAVLQQIGHFAKDDGNVALLFKTHPHPDERIDKLGAAMGDKYDRVKGQSLKSRFYRIATPVSVAVTPAPDAVTPAPNAVAPAPVANPDQKTIDEQYNIGAATKCKAGFFGLVCREALKTKLCEGKWTETPSAGQSLCKRAANKN
jgi:predicted Zn-dependent protease